MSKRNQIDGALVVDKPSGPTSHDIVEQVRRQLRCKAGHTGTLDPLATGVLVLLLGRATRLSRYMQAHDKEYQARIRLGRSTDTHDREGETIEERPVPQLSDEQVEAALDEFRGDIEQKAPMYSAVKVKGKKLYEYARKGQEAERPTRRVHIEALEVLERGAESWTLRVECSAGTYLRTLAHEIGQRLGCGAHVEKLRRTRVGSFTLQRSLAPEEAAGKWRDSIYPLRELPPEFPAVEVDSASARRILNGNQVVAPGASKGRVRVVAGGRLLAVADCDGVSLQPKTVFN